MHKVDIFEIPPSELAKLHFDILNWSFTGRLGLEFIESLYTEILKHKDMFWGKVLIDDNKNILGFYIISNDYNQSRKILTPLYKGKVIDVLKNSLKDFSFLGIVFESKLIIPYFFNKYKIKHEWLVFVTDTRDKKKQLAASLSLCKSLVRESKNRKVINIIAQFYANQDKLSGFYNMIGGKIVKKLLVNDIIIYDFSESKL